MYDRGLQLRFELLYYSKAHFYFSAMIIAIFVELLR